MKKYYIVDDLTRTKLAGPFTEKQQMLDAYEKAVKEYPDAHVAVSIVDDEDNLPQPPQPDLVSNNKQIIRKRWMNIAAGFWMAAYVEHMRNNFKKSKEYIKKAKDAEGMADPMFLSVFGPTEIDDYLHKFEQYGERNVSKIPTIKGFFDRLERERTIERLHRNREELERRKKEELDRDRQRRESWQRGFKNLPAIGDVFELTWTWMNRPPYKNKRVARKGDLIFIIDDSKKKLKGTTTGTGKFKVVEVVKNIGQIYDIWHAKVEPIED